jgi:hypothetical protein
MGATLPNAQLRLAEAGRGGVTCISLQLGPRGRPRARAPPFHETASRPSAAPDDRMSALLKASILLLLSTAIAASLYVVLDDGGFDLVRSQPHDEICQHDGDRLARLRAKPAFDEALNFASEIRCVQLWPQLQTILDGLSSPSRSTQVSHLNGAASDTRSANDAAPTTAAPEPTSAALEDACRHDEDRLAELRAKPSIDAAIRFDSGLRCPRLQPQLPAILGNLSHAAGSVDAASRNAPGTPTAGETSPPPSAPPAMEAASAPTDDACTRDEERLADLQAKPSLTEALRFGDELKCSRLRPRLLALLDSFSQAPQSAGAPGSNGVPPNTTSADEAAPPIAEAASPPPANATPASEVPPAAPESPAMEAASAPPDVVCTRDEDRLDRLRQKPSKQEAARFAEELSCEKLRPQLLALAGDLARSQPGSEGVSKDAAAETNTTNEPSPAWRTFAASQAAAEAPSAEHTTSTPSPQPVTPVEPSETQSASQAVVDAEHRIAALERERDALAAEVDRLGRHQETSPEEVASLPPLSATTAAPAPATSPEGPPHSEAVPSGLELRAASLAAGMPARVLIRYPRNNADVRRRAQSLADALTKQGLEVADLRESDGAVRTDLSFFYVGDAASAQRIGALVGIAPARRPQPKDGLMARPGAIELSLSGESRLPVITTSRKETIHE